jgi:hypothetical protein
VKDYTVTINGIDHTMQLSDEDADRLGLVPNVEVKKSAASNKARTTTANKAKG